MAKLETLVDAFTGSTINPSLWNATVGTATLDTVNDQVSLGVPTTSGASTQLATTSTWDATNSSVYAQVGAPFNGNAGVAVGMRLSKDTNNNTLIRVLGGTLSALITTGGTAVATTLATYDRHAHRWWRISEAASKFSYAVSPDGLNWTTLATLTYGWSATAVTFEFLTAVTTTEVAGNVALLSHLNTRTGGQFNPNWPTLEYGAGLTWGANGGTVPLDGYVDVSARTQGSTTVNRGRQYELDQVRAGEESATLGNTDDVLNPTSASSPFAGRMQPFQPFRLRAQWPPTPNLFSQGVATGGDTGGASTGTITASTVLDLLSDTDTTGGSVVASTTAWAGGRVAQFSVPVASAVGARVVHCGQVAVVPGQPYTAQMRVRNVTSSTGLQVKPFVGWPTTAGSATPTSYTYGTTQTLTGSATAGWTTLTVSGTAPAGAYGIDVGVAVAAAAAATCSVQTDGWQLEEGLVVSPWVCPGYWYPLYAGFTEDWQSQWTMSGTYGTVSPPCADAFSLLSQLTLQDPLTMELNSHGLRYLYTLADPEGSTTFTDTTGSFPALPIGSSKYGAGTVAAGTAIAAASASGVYTGATGTVVTITNPSPGTTGNTGSASFLSLAGAGILGPRDTTFTRMIAFKWAGGSNPASEAEVWTAMDTHGGGSPGGQLRVYIDSAGHLNAIMSSFATGSLTLSSTTAVADGNWHLALFGQDTTGPAATFFLSVDGAFTSTDASGGGGHGAPYFPLALTSDAVGAAVYASTKTVNDAFTGDVSYVAEMPTALTSTDCSNLYTAWRSAAGGESSAARYARILRYAGYTGPTSISTGLTSSMGPAAISGQDVVSALEGVVTTENGNHFVARDGSVTFLGRNTRYNAMTPAITFGENTAAGEIPYENVQTVFDSTHLGNKIAVTQESTGQQFYATDAASIAAYFPRTITRTVNTSSGLEAQDAANYFKARYKQPQSRVAPLVVHPAANPAIWPALLGLELSTRARVMRRPPGVQPTQLEVFVENIAWSLDDKADATVTLQCSPADTTQYAIFAAWHSTVKTTVASGVSAITVNASQDTTNPLGLQIAAGQQLVLGQGTANQETVTVSSIGATVSGWTSAVINLTAPTTKPHTAGEWVNEPLPAGVTDPTVYDAASAFDAVAFAY